MEVVLTTIAPVESALARHLIQLLKYGPRRLLVTAILLLKKLDFFRGENLSSKF